MKLIKQKLNKLALAAALSVSLGLVASSTYADRYVYVTHGQSADPFWSIVKNGAKTAAKDLGLELDYRSPQQFDAVRMARLIDAAVATNPDGLIVSVPDAKALSASIEKAVKKGIPVITINAGEEASKKLGALMHIGQSEYAAAVKAGKYMKARGVTNGVCVNQEQGNSSLDARCAGFVEGLGGKADVLATSMDPTEIRNAILAYLKQHPDVNGILTLGSTAAEPAVDALAAYKKGDHGIKLGTFDLSPRVLQDVSDGKIEFALDQQQFLQGYLPLMVMNNYNKFKLLPSDISTGPNLITKDKAAAVIKLSKAGYR
ncbi:MAG: sugar ABC transporter substrate-binding protein [Oceanospirillaceae bacterium]|nr:sugar ABC transporter substrate-binding protein [Oceanospirillaceae bacterium]